MNKSIEVTPEMIKAGAEEMVAHWTDFEYLDVSSPEWGQRLAAVYRAMYLAQVNKVESRARHKDDEEDERQFSRPDW